MKRTFALVLAVGALSLSAAQAGEDRKGEETPPKSISDRELSLYSGSLFEVPNPPGFVANSTDPGENERLPRPFPIAPPRVPHGVAEFEPIALGANACLDCHALGAGADAPELPPSHRTDLRRSPQKAEATVAGARWQCLACHVATSDAQPLRANSAAPR